MRAIERFFMLQVLDGQWKDHLASMDYLRQGIHLRGYAQKQPKQEFKREAFELFSSMLERVKNEVVTILARVRIRSEEEVAALEAEQQQKQQRQPMQFQHADPGNLGVDEEAAQVQQLAHAQRRAGGRGAGRAARSEGRPQRPVSLRLGQEVQAVPRPPRLRPAQAERVPDSRGATWSRYASRNPRDPPQLHETHPRRRRRSCATRRAAYCSRSAAPASTSPACGSFPAARSSPAKRRSRRCAASCTRSSASTSTRRNR